MFVRLHPNNPEERKIQQIVEELKKGAIIIYPTDTVYGIGCDINNPKAIEKLYRIKNVSAKDAKFSFVCDSLSNISNYTKAIDTPIFKLLKKCLPGPYTFILEANKAVPKLLQTKKNTVGIRIPDNKICLALVEALGNPIISTSLPESQEIDEYVDPDVFYYLFEKQVDIVIDGGIGSLNPSTVVDCTSGIPEIIREGAGSISIFV
jgi:tRNA threonylcarbamoyl adenosine modification protein (Sua5/YciO/YrdC/YwlC family)